MITLALLRHGHTEWNRAGRIQGRTDVPLDDAARQALSELALPRGWAKAELVSSPLVRATETARIVAGRDPHPVPELIEMDWGDWEGQRGEDLRSNPASGFRDIEHWGWTWRPPGGECPAEVRARLWPWLSGLQHDTLAVCHIGVMRVILACAYRWNFKGMPPFRIKRTRLYTVTIPAEGPNRMVPGQDPIRLIRKEN